MPNLDATLYDPDGQEIWSRRDNVAAKGVISTGSQRRDEISSLLLGVGEDPNIKPVELTRVAEELQMVTRQRAAKEFFTEKAAKSMIQSQGFVER